MELGRANAPEVSARKTGFAALGVFANRLVNSVRRTLERAAIARELSALDDRELSDIGLGRGDIMAVAEASVAKTGEPSLAAAFGELVHDLLVAPVVLWNKRRAAFGALNALDDRMLSDIGVARAEIGSVVKGLHKSVSYPAVTLDVVAPIAAWNRARVTANQLYRLEDRMLADIGVVRGDIDWVASEVAQKAVAANRNAPAGQPSAA
ncbi:MAG TPA: DUF1127 domain-containing protein [Dongiaceae bacterium]|nr:DUF1127 domain-containing protein [Dongiaceae bacterium]